MRLNISVIILFFSVHSFAQQPTQTIRGVVLDQFSGAPVPFASIVLPGAGQRGTTADSSGNFSIPKVPVGRYDVKVSLVGYQQALIREVVVSSAKEVFLTVFLEERSSQLKEVTVRPLTTKEKPLNNMAIAGARMLSVEEAGRYAGGFDDPARLASSFAGVSSNTGNNGIVVRGNAPQYLQWKMEGIEIPNPNHFADVTVFGGGGLTALSSQLLANSDFFTGAFPAEYSNAVSGVFDIYMRNGNNKEHENTFQAGLTGIDFSSEGPFKKGKRSSYLFNYRYSTLALASPLLPEDAGNVRYQDLSFKLNFPTKRAGTFSFWGIGLKDRSGEKAETDSLKWEYYEDREEQKIIQYMGAAGLSNKLFLNSQTFLKTSLAATVSSLNFRTDSLDQNLIFSPQNRIRNTNWNFVFTSFLNTKFSASHTNKTGITVTGLLYDLSIKESLKPSLSPETLVSGNDMSTLLSAYTSSSFNLNDKAVFSIGLTGQMFTLNNKYSIEPRAGFRWQGGKNWSVGAAYGLHSRLERLSYYFARSQKDNELINKDLGFTRAHHFILSFDQKLSDILHLKIEPYYQQLFNVPVIADSSFSVVNMQDNWFFRDKLQNSGKTKAYGIDLTMERYLDKNYYFLVTASVFNAKYQGGNGLWYNSRFNRNYLFNFLIGKEWRSGKNGENVWSLNTRFAVQGGDRFSPVNDKASIETRSVVFDEARAFQNQFPGSFVTHLTASHRVNRKGRSRELALKIINATGQKDYSGFRYKYVNRTVTRDEQATFIPNISYKIEF